jgi:hypothetical protein
VRPRRVGPSLKRAAAAAARGARGGGPQAGEPGYAEQWLGSPARRILLPHCRFADPGLEAAFQAAVAPGRRRLLTAGLGLNALAVALEWRMGGAARGGPRDPTAGLPWPEGEEGRPAELRVRAPRPLARRRLHAGPAREITPASLFTQYHTATFQAGSLLENI